jgi:hypothetical protein
LDPGAAGRVTGDNRNAHQAISATETFSRQVGETENMLKKIFEEEASGETQKVRWFLILFH